MAQVDYKKIVTGLTFCSADPNGCPRSGCPYWEEEHCEFSLVTDALALIKELMPRVLTLDEAICADECWFEWKDGPQGYAEILWSFKDTVAINRIQSHGATDVSIYRKAWRCWSHRPTDEQRKAEKWE